MGPEFSFEGGIYHNNGLGGIKEDWRRWTLPAGALAVSLANYSMPNDALIPMNAIAGLMYNEMPGAFDEIIPPIKQTKLTELPNVQQAWSTYGIIWPVISKFVGIQPNIPERQISIIPNPPSSWNRFSLEDITIGETTYSMHYESVGNARRVSIISKENQDHYDIETGVTVPNDATIHRVMLNGDKIGPSEYEVVQKNGRHLVLVNMASCGPIEPFVEYK